jgi:hypothetical protein
LVRGGGHENWCGVGVTKIGAGWGSRKLVWGGGHENWCGVGVTKIRILGNITLLMSEMLLL